MKKVMIVGVGISQITMETFTHHNMGVVISSSNPEFEPEPIRYSGLLIKGNETVFFEKEPSKFISKPKNNFKKYK